MTIIRCMVPERDRHNFMSFWATFLPQKIKIKKKWKKAWRYHHFKQAYQKSWSYAILFLRHGSWMMWLLCFIWAIFCPNTPPTAQKNKIEKKWMHGDIIILHKCNKNHDHMLYCSWEIYCSWVTDVIVIFHFGLFFALLPHWQPKKQN